MALVRWIQMGILLGSLLFGWLLGSKNEDGPALAPAIPKMEITVRLQDGERESLWTGYVVLADSTSLGKPDENWGQAPVSQAGHTIRPSAGTAAEIGVCPQFQLPVSLRGKR